MANPTTKNGLRLISAKISLPWQLECNSFNAFGVLFIVPICATHLYVTVAPPLIFRVPVLVDFNCAPVFRFWILVGGAGVVLLAPELERKLAVLWASRTMEALNVCHENLISQYVGSFMTSRCINSRHYLSYDGATSGRFIIRLRAHSG